ncbi:FMN reductase [Hyphomicrobium sulfonivorans]|uniref:FMN reductase n=2 Tax=Hyphomicrobium sulfonivorans TaxID=121290 RepID=A0A109BMV7_HYPSL|nr:FMN reductase [Hyphomicrobium sulfonivorans]
MTEQADLLILGTPVYRATYTGVFKHFFDLVDRDAMRDRKAVLCATGGSPLHGLMLEHQMRPLMGFFSMQTITTGLFGLTDDFADGRVVSPDLNKRIERVTSEVVAAFAPAQALAS